MKPYLIIATAFVCCTCPLSAQSDDLMDLTLNDLLNMEVKVEVASKNAESIWAAPGIISVMNAAEIEQFGANSLIDLLNRVTSVYMLNTYFSPNNFTSFRGDSQTNYDNHVLLLINGRPLRESMNGSFNAVIYQAFPVSVLDRIEVIRGPGSAIYGAGAYSGVINLVIDSSKQSDLEVMGGSFSGVGAHVKHGGAYRGLAFLISASQFSEDGWDFDAIDETGQPQTIDFAEENYSFLSTLNYKEWSFTAMAVNSTYDYWGTTPIGVGLERDITRIFSNLGWKKTWDTLGFEANLTYNRMDIDDGVTNEADDLLGEATLYYTPNEKVNIILGYLLNRQSGLWEGLVPDYRLNDSSLYVQAEYKPSDKFKLIGGGQLNMPDEGDSDFVPRAGAIINFNENTGIKALHGEAYRSPALIETRFSAPPILSGNPDLIPENVATSEVQIFHESKTYQLAATYYHTEQDHLIGRTFNPEGESLFSYNNIGAGTFQGVELEAKYAPSETWYATFAFTYQENENSEGQDGFSTLPNELAKFGVVRRLSSHVTFGLFNSYFGKAEGVITTNPDVVNLNPEANAFHLVSANLSASIPNLEGLKVSLFGQNLLDEDTYQPEVTRRRMNTIPAYPGRSIYLKIGWAF